jgi:hypothetical protein
MAKRAKTTEPQARKSLLLAITCDPRSSHRPAEAIRLAAGVAAWRKVDVTLYFGGPAVLAVNSDPDDFVDEESYTRYLPMCIESGCSLFIESGSPFLEKLIPGELAYQKISQPDFARLAAGMNYLLRF